MRRLKFQLDRKALEKIYTSFIRPILELEMKFGIIECNTKRMNLNRFN